MTAETLAQTEGTPEAWPDLELSEGVSASAVWQRLEARMAHRFAPRPVVWIVRGPGWWRAPLGPVVEIGFEGWAEGWQPVEVRAGPLGWYVGHGEHRATATVGAGPVPEAVIEAARRLGGYLAAQDRPGITQWSEAIDGASAQAARPKEHMARALDQSGAGDLLRPWRRA
jgi:hypothetical protein